jgi:uncharacterized protein YecE (DUF72 family)
MIRFGPAGFQYKDWEGIVYPAPKPKGFDQLAYLASYFDTIEINSTFYGPARPSTIESWVKRVEHNPDFRFTAKLYQRFTHQRKTPWTKADVAEVRAGFDPLMASGKLGAVLLQFPWSFRRTDENREWLDDLTATFADYPLVLEVRHSSWNVPAYFDELGDRGVGFVNIDQPLFHDSIKPSAVATSHVGYVRVHGRNFKDWFRQNAGRDARYDYLYSAAELEPWAERTKELAQEPATDDVYVVTNNHYRGKAVANALMLQQMVEGQKPAAPSALFDEYGDVLAPYAVPSEPEDPLVSMIRAEPEAEAKPKSKQTPRTRSTPKPKSAAKAKRGARKKTA